MRIDDTLSIYIHTTQLELSHIHTNTAQEPVAHICMRNNDNPPDHQTRKVHHGSSKGFEHHQ